MVFVVDELSECKFVRLEQCNEPLQMGSVAVWDHPPPSSLPGRIARTSFVF